jgi:serine/threonine-protein kinase PknK
MPERDGPGDRYLLQRVLGEGGAGRVWLVEDSLRPGSSLALKEIHADGADGLHHEEELRREFATLARLKHPNLVEVHEFDASPESGLPRFTLEFIEGRSIVDAVAHEGPPLLLDLAAEGLRALAFLHDFGLIHRDLKPGNLLVRDRPKLGCRLVLVDFGLVEPGADEPLEAHRAKGTLPYMAPELFRNERATPRSDLYALGAVLFEAAHGRPPLSPSGPDLTRFVVAVSEGRRARPPLPAGHAPGLDLWIEEMLAPDPALRPATASEALARLNEACGKRFPIETPAGRAARLMSGPPAGREAEIAALRSTLDPASGPRVVWLEGSPGSGKTRILRWLEAEAVLEGWKVVSSDPDLVPSLDGLRAAASRSPVLVTLDDADAAGSPAAEFLDRLARESDRPPLQAVAAIRPGPAAHPVLRKLVADTGTVPTLRRVALRRLDADAIRAMATRAAGGAVSEERVQWILEASEGSSARADSLLISGAWERGGQAGSKEAGDELPVGRLEMLAPPARAWLDALAVLESDAEEGPLLRLCGLDAVEGRAAAEEASAAGLAQRRKGRWHADSRALAERLRARMEPEHRRALHRAAAESVEAAGAEAADPRLLARLWEEAGDRARAASWAERAAARAEEAGDPVAAASLWARALHLLGRERIGRHGLRERQARALADAGLYPAASRAWGAASRLAPTPADRAGALARQAHSLVQAGRFDRALRVAERAAELASATGSTEHLALARKAAGIVLGRLGRETEAIPLLGSALTMIEGRGDLEAEADILQLLATCRVRLGEEGAEADFAEAIGRYRAARRGTGEPGAQELKALLGLGFLKARAGGREEAVPILEGVRDAAAGRGSLGLEEAAIARLAMVAIDAGELDRAIVLAEQAADLALHLGDPNLLLVDQCRLADARIRCGRAGEAVPLLQEALGRPTTRVEPENADYARMLLAYAWMETGATEDGRVRALLEECLARCRGRSKRRPLLMALAIEMERRARPGCQDPFEPASKELDAVVASSSEPLDPEIRIRRSLARAAWRLARGDAEGARGEAEEAVEAARSGGAPAFEARARAALSCALERAGREEEARQALREGRRLLSEAAGRIASEEVRADFLRCPAFAPLAEEAAAVARGADRRLLALYDMIRTLNSETDPEALLEAILDMALGAVGAERGMILLKEDREGTAGEESSVRLARGLETETERDAESYSRSVVAAAGEGRSLLALDAGSDPRFRDLKSVSLYGIRSLMCVPLRSRGRIIGTVYLDCRRGGTLFTPDDLRFVEAFSDHAALALENTRARARLERRNRELLAAADVRTSFASIIGRSAPMQAVFDLIEKVAATDLPVLIQGESGTGKELVARAIHAHGPRRRRTFLTENCAAIPETLLESELFGHVRGAFTGAERSHPGLFEQADGGTLFLDEVGDMSPGMQARLLRVLEEGEVRRVGGEATAHVNVRILAATHRDLASETRSGRFREDLLYRLQVLTVEIPPLRKRPGDVALLAEHFLARIAAERGRPTPPIDDEALAVFERYAWPGNVRELQNALQRLALLAGACPIGLDAIESDPQLRRILLPMTRSREPAFSLRTGEREQILAAIEAARGNRKRAAALLGVSRATLYRKLGRHRI